MPWGLSTATYIAIAAAAASAAGTYMSSQAAAGAADYNKKVSLRNAQLARQNADWTAAEGEQATGLAGIKAKSGAGAIKVAQAANNVDVNSGSAVSVQQSQKEAGLLDLSNIRSNAARRAYGYEAQAGSEEGQANLYGAEATADRAAGYVSAAGKLAGGAAQAYGASPSSTPDINYHSDNPSGTPGASLLGNIGGSNWHAAQTESSLF